MKNLQKGFAIPIVIAIVALLVVGGGAYIYTNNKVEVPINAPDITNNLPATTSSNLVGGDRDAHGCIGSAGYSWCEVKNKCLRTWEEKCEVTTTTTKPAPVACTMDAMQCPDGSYVGRTGSNCEFVCPVTSQDKIQISAHFDKNLYDSFGTDYFRVKDADDNIYKMIFSNITGLNYYNPDFHIPYEKGSFVNWLNLAKECFSGITPEGSLSLEHTDILCRQARQADFIGIKVGSQEIQLKEVVVYTN